MALAACPGRPCLRGSGWWGPGVVIRLEKDNPMTTTRTKAKPATSKPAKKPARRSNIGKRSIPEPSTRTETPGGSDTVPRQPARPGGKLGLLVKHLASEVGATVAELARATGWQAHTVHGALSRLRARGFAVRLGSVGERRAYRLVCEQTDRSRTPPPSPRRRGPAAGTLAENLAGLVQRPYPDLQAEWRWRCRAPAPKTISRELLELGIA